MSVAGKPPAAGGLDSRAVTRCRICGSEELHRYLDLGRTPLANAYLKKEELDHEEFGEDLCIQLCRRCGLSQLTQVVHPDRMFRNYFYVSSTTRTIRYHFAEFAKTLVGVVGAECGDVVLDIASNDGLLLSCFKNEGLEVVGVDPARNLAEEANAKGIRTLCGYWSDEMARRVAAGAGRPKIITAANVFAHADDLSGFMRGVAEALAPGGVFAIECPWLIDFITRNEFDTAYHEHVSYVGVTPLTVLMEAHGFEVFDVDYFPDIPGGTIRVVGARRGERAPTRALKDMLAREQSFGIRDAAPYDTFTKRVLGNREALRALIEERRQAGKTIWAYGAGAKGNTLMNFFGLDSTQVPKAVDDNPKKWGYYTPGSRMEIVGIDALLRAEVDYLLLLAWNFETEIRRRCAEAGYTRRFILPVPEARVVGEET